MKMLIYKIHGVYIYIYNKKIKNKRKSITYLVKNITKSNRFHLIIIILKKRNTYMH